ncbi:MAG TPA: PAS domain S-box protein [Polyangiaceae bacterium]|nr:PAS domain S-box protein [Polyangiaceae bacterium]
MSTGTPVDSSQFGEGSFRLLVESVTDYAIFLLDPEGRVRTWNRGAERIKGYRPADIIGQHFSTFYLPSDVATGHCERELETALREGRFEDYGWRVRKDGSQFWANVIITALHDDTGRHVGFGKVTRDLTDKAYRAFVEATNAIIWTTDGRGRPNADSPSWRAFTGQTESEWRGLEGWAPVHPDDRKWLEIQWPEASRGGCGFDAQFRLRRKDGEYSWMQARAIPFSNPNGSVREWFGVTFDITASKLLEAERQLLLERERTAREQAELANRTKDEFLATVSHELRNPLNAILGWAKLLLRRDLPDDVLRHLATIERNARAQARLIEDVLDVSRIISGKLSLELRDADVAQAVLDAVESARPLAEAKGVALETKIAPGLELRADQLRLQQIVSNLLSNAVKFTPGGGRIVAEADRAGASLRLIVADTGEGIEPALLSLIFEPFRQADATTTRRYAGLGLGLAIVKELVHAHGGSVRAESQGKGLGATFIVDLPTRSSQGPSVEEKSAARLLPRLEGARILVVDDEPDAVEIVAELLGSVGAVVEGASSAEEVLKKLPAFLPQVLVSDIGMPGMDGYALIRTVRALDRTQGGQTPALALTAYTRKEDVERSLSAGFQAHLGKPVDAHKLLATIAGLAGRAA